LEQLDDSARLLVGVFRQGSILIIQGLNMAGERMEGRASKAPLEVGTTEPFESGDVLSSLEMPKRSTRASHWLIDRFIPVQYNTDERVLYRARILISISYIYTLLTTACLFWMWFASPFELHYLLTGSMLLGPLIVFFFLLPSLFLYVGHYSFMANLAVLVSFTIITMGIFLGGGPLASPVNYLMVVPPFMAIILVGFQYGLLWSVMVFVVELMMMYLHFSPYQFPSLFDHRYYPEMEVVSWLISFSAAVGSALVYDSTSQRLQAQLQLRQRAFEVLATHDVLTGLPNRALFEDRLNTAILKGERSGDSFALLYLDLDGFKPVNDREGHAAGDLVLKTIAARLIKSVRKVDTVARLGGDEFVILINNVEERKRIVRVVESMLSNIAEPFDVAGKDLSITASIGIAVYPKDGSTAELLQNRSDIAMYKAKKSGGQYCFYHHSLRH
jgi:diguanylate cyclase (GGDEF)-like protein